MKKLLIVLTVAGMLVACNDGADGTTSTDTMNTMTTDTNTMTTITTDTSGMGMGMDTMNRMMTDSMPR